MPWTLPNLLTLARIAAVAPVALLLARPEAWAAWAALALFAAACATDWLDGRIARARGQFSAFGRAFDPIADKLLVAACLILLAADGRIAGWDLAPALAVLLREVLVSGLREALAGALVIHVTRLAKWKTAAQMAALGLVIIGPQAPDAAWAGSALLWLAGGLTLLTGWGYLRASLPALSAADAAASASASAARQAARPST